MFLLPACATDPNAPEFVDTVPYVDGEVLVSIAGGDADEMDVDDENGFEEAERIDQINVRRVYIPEGRTVRSVVEKLSEDHRVAFVEPNLLVHQQGANLGVSDPYSTYQWNLAEIRADKAWAYGTGTGVIVAVLDTGFKSGGTDGVATVLSGYDWYNRDSNPTDGNGHGTFVSNEIAQKTNNAVGVAGVAPGVSILPVKVMGDDGSGDISAIASGITYAADKGAQVINMSLGSAYSSSTLESACSYAYGKNVTLVAATGNEYASSLNYPAAYASVIAVGAVGYGGTRAGYSNRGTGIDLVAPGGDLSKDANGDGYADGILQEVYERGWTYTFWEGTSMAAPHVAGAAALVYAAGATTPSQVYSVLTGTAIDRGSSGYDTAYGYGEVDIYAAVVKQKGGSSSGSTGSGSTGSGSTGSGSTGSGSTGSTTTDTTAPVISSVYGSVQGRKMTIQWVTDEPATTYLDFETYGEYGDSTLTTSHTLSLTGTRGTTYYFDIVSTDAAGNTATDGQYYLTL